MFLAKCTLVLLAAVAANGYNLGFGDVVFHLFSRSNPSISEPLLPSQNSILGSSIDIFAPTIITIHSNGEGVGGNFNAFVIPAYLEAEDVNLIAVDWSVGGSMYTQGLANAPQVGEIIADFMNILIGTFGYSVNNFRIVGVGLGGHIAGIAARNALGEVPHIIALDPSLHGWTHHTDKLNPDDATTVEVLHTTASRNGYDYPLGDIDFYPNGGTYQTGCGEDVSCSHIYSYVFYYESIEAELDDGAKFVGTACSSYEDAIAMTCDGDRDAVFGGTEDKTGTSGIYTFSTNFGRPFAQG